MYGERGCDRISCMMYTHTMHDVYPCHALFKPNICTHPATHPISHTPSHTPIITPGLSYNAVGFTYTTDHDTHQPPLPPDDDNDDDHTHPPLPPYDAPPPLPSDDDDDASGYDDV